MYIIVFSEATHEPVRMSGLSDDLQAARSFALGFLDSSSGLIRGFKQSIVGSHQQSGLIDDGSVLHVMNLSDSLIVC
jgi:hypothetical protein